MEGLLNKLKERLSRLTGTSVCWISQVGDGNDLVTFRSTNPMLPVDKHRLVVRVAHHGGKLHVIEAIGRFAGCSNDTLHPQAA